MNILSRGVLGLLERLTRTETTLTEFGASTALILLGTLFVLPIPDQLHPSVPLHAALVSLMSENHWGYLFLACGAFQSVSNLRRFLWGRRISAFVEAILFGFLSIVAWRTHPPSLLGPVFAVQSLLQSLVYLRLSIIREQARAGARV